MYTNKSRPFTIPIIFMTEELLPLLEGEYIQWLLQRRMRTHLSILPSQCSLFIIII